VDRIIDYLLALGIGGSVFISHYVVDFIAVSIARYRR
jgi:hypothetical protein